MIRKKLHNTLNISGYLLDLNIPKVMGILNVTDDSFYSKSRAYTEDSIKHRVKQMVAEGVDIIDIGGCSTRPGFSLPSEKEEKERVDMGCGIVREIAQDIPLSIDTFRATIAKHAIETWKIDIINDVSGGIEPEIWHIVSDYKKAYVLTHNSGDVKTKQDITAQLITDLSKKVSELHRLGVNDVIIDPGFGFGKTIKDNFKLLDELNEIVKMGLPVLVGISRKSMIYKSLDSTPENSLYGTIALDAIALEKGADILRVHDVKAAKETITLYSQLKNLAYD